MHIRSRLESSQGKTRFEAEKESQSMIVKFIEVGRDHLTWEQDIPLVEGQLDGDAMWKAVKSKAMLRSNCIDFYDDGTICVGMFRPVGRWEPQEPIGGKI